MAYQPFFVTGAPKSGTTWLGKLLDAHPEISCKGEACIHFFGKALIAAANSYNELLERRLANVSASNAFSPMKEAEVMALYRAFVEARMALIVDPAKTGLRFVGEKDPLHGPNFPVLKKLFPEAKYLNIIRDGRGVLVSAWHHNKRQNHPDFRHATFDRFLDDTAQNWSGMVRRSRATGPDLGAGYLELRYEALVADTGPTFQRVLAHLGAEASDATVQACVEAASFERLTKGRSQGQEDASSFFRKGDPTDWRNHMSAAQVARFETQSGGLIRELGYPVN